MVPGSRETGTGTELLNAYGIFFWDDENVLELDRAWKIPWAEEPGRLQSMGSLGVGHD